MVRKCNQVKMYFQQNPNAVKKSKYLPALRNLGIFPLIFTMIFYGFLDF